MQFPSNGNDEDHVTLCPIFKVIRCRVAIDHSLFSTVIAGEDVGGLPLLWSNILGLKISVRNRFKAIAVNEFVYLAIYDRSSAPIALISD